MKDKIVIVTGSNSGIGKATALRLAGMGAHVILACRNEEKANKVLKQINNKGGSAEYMHIDLASLDSVRDFARTFNERYDHLDVLICNAGILSKPRFETKDGFEKHFGVNYLSHFLLTLLLLKPLLKAKQGRDIILSSLAHAWTYIHFDDINLTKEYNVKIGYGQSKLCNLLFAKELTKRLEKFHTNFTMNALHPGVVATNIVYNRDTGKGKALANMSHIALTPVSKGCKTSVYLASSPDVSKISGKYFYHCKEKEPAPAGLDMDVASKLFNYSCELVNIDWNKLVNELF